MNIAGVRSCFTVGNVKIFFVIFLIYSTSILSIAQASGGNAPPPPPPAAPVISPSSGIFESTEVVNMSSGFAVYYTTNGSAPNLNSPKYLSPITLSETTSIKARAVNVVRKTTPTGSPAPCSGGTSCYDYYWSTTASKTYTHVPPALATPEITPDTGSFSDSVYITFHSQIPGANFYYTVDGSTPTISSSLYVAPVLLTNTATVKVIGVHPEYSNSLAASANITVNTSNGGTGGSGGSGGGSNSSNNELVGSIPGNFSVNSSGGATYSIPLAVPAGTAGLEPQLSFNYSSQGRNGLLGLGWSIVGLSVIHRCPTTLAKDGYIDPVDFDSNDQFCLDGQPLIVINGGIYGAEGTEYRTEINSFSKIISRASTANGPDSFEVWTKSGEKMLYGFTEDSRINPPSATHPNATPQNIAICWLLNEVSDTASNYMTISYIENESTGENYPQKIEYTGNTRQNINPYNSIEFTYEDRTDPGKRYLSGLLMNSTKRLKDVMTKNGSSLVKKYTLSYINNTPSQNSMLQLVRECDADGKCVSPTIFDWETGGESEFTNASGINSYVASPAFDGVDSTKRVSFSDFNGDGITDIINMSTNTATAKICFGTESGNVKTTCEDTGVVLGDLGKIKFADFNGDGYTDLYHIDDFQENEPGPTVSYCLIQGHLANCSLICANNPGTCSSPPEHFDRFSSIYLSNGDGTFGDSIKSPIGTRLRYEVTNTATSGGGTSSFFSAPFDIEDRIQFVDANGDGRQDIFYTKSNASPVDYLKNNQSSPGGLNTNALNAASTHYIYLSNGDGTFSSPIDSQVDYDSPHYSGSGISRRHFGEFNGDGMTDIYLINGDGNTATGSVFLSDGDGTYTYKPGISTSIGDNDYRAAIDYSRFNFIDLNGDGLTDLYFINGYSNNVPDLVYLAKGDGTFNSPIETSFSTYIPAYRSLTSEPTTSYMRRIRFGEFTGDGVVDVYYITGTSSSVDIIYPGIGNGNFAAPISGYDLWGSGAEEHETLDMARIAFSDFNGDGATDIYRIEGFGNSAIDSIRLGGAKKHLLKQVKNGLDVAIDIEYKALTDNTVFEKGDCVGNSCWPNIDLQIPMYVVSESHTDSAVSNNPQNSISYFYKGLKVNAQGRGLLGYAQRTVTDTVNKDDGDPANDASVVVDTFYRQDFPFVGLEYKSKTRVNDVATSSSEVNNFTYQGVLPGPVFPYPSMSTAYSCEPSGPVNDNCDDNNGILLTKVTISSTYDTEYNLGDLDQIIVTTEDTGIDTYVTTTNNNYFSPDETNWILGRLKDTTVTKTGGDHPSPGDRFSSFTYDNATGFLQTETIEAGNQALTKTYTHDNFGNRLSVTESGNGIVSRSTQTEYDAQGQFPTKIINALGHEETRGNYDVYGNPGFLIGPNGLTTSWEYDSLGRKIREMRADGTETRVSYAYCENCESYVDGLVQYSVTTESLKTSGNTKIAATTVQYYDAVNRVIMEETENFDGSKKILSATEYDAEGRVMLQTLPYFSNVTSTYGTTYEYDSLSRVDKESSSATGVTKYSYYGFEATVTQDVGGLNQTSSEKTNSLGQTLEVTDADGKVLEFEYDSHGNLKKVIDVAGNVTENFYNLRGFKTGMNDPDMGSWSYHYNILGELISQADAESQTVTMTYDKLGRLITRNDPGSNEGTTTWVYDNCAKGVGKLCSVSHYGGYSRTHAYDNLGRPSNTVTVIGGSSYTSSNTYDDAGRADEITYPSGFKVKNQYNALGYLESVADPQNTVNPYYKVNQTDQFGNVVEEEFGNGVSTNRVFEDATGRVQTIITGGLSVQHLTYVFDTLGNLKQRKDHIDSLTEDMVYDTLNRLKKVTTISSGISGVEDITYDNAGLGNIKTRSGVGTYMYGNGAGPHAVTSIAGVHNATYTYDDNGNQISGDGRTQTWSSFNKPVNIIKGSNSTAFKYGPDRARYEQVAIEGSTTTTTTYIGSMYEKVEIGSTVEEKHFIRAGSIAVAIHTQSSSASDKTEYLHRDHLGSVDVITNINGGIVEKLSFDAFGKRRMSNWSNGVPTIVSNNTRGFTGHEMLDGVGLIHMNGRVYDPLIGRFISADPTMQFAKNMQNYNRYSYVLNNPLSYTDSSGFFLDKAVKGFLRGAKRAFRNPSFVAFASILTANIAYAAAYGSALSAGAAGVSAGPVALSSSTYAGAVAAAKVVGATAGGFAGGFVGSGGDIKAGLIGGISAGAGALLVGSGVIAHGVVGGVSSELQGDNFRDGFIEATLSAKFGGHGVIADAVVGGTVSRLNGGKFANGAANSAFASIISSLGNSAQLSRQQISELKLSRDIYKVTPGDVGFLNIDGYTLAEIYDGTNGFRAALFVSGNSSVVVYEGTDIFSGGDWVANFRQAFGFSSSQYTQAIDLASSSSLARVTRYAGHSLGGGLAASVAIQRNGTATILNSAGVHSNTIRGFSRSRGSVTHAFSQFDVLQPTNILTPARVPGIESSLGIAGFHGSSSALRNK